MVTRFEVLLEIRHTDGQAVSFKQDGQRFTDPTTVKLCCDEKYKLYLRFKPSFKLRAWFMEDDGINFEEEEQPINRKEHQDMAAYNAVWHTQGFSPSKNGDRHNLKIRLELENDQILETVMQVKFYHIKRSTACKWGTPMKVLDLSCDAKPGNQYITVRRGSIL